MAHTLCTKPEDLRYFPRAALRCGQPKKNFAESSKEYYHSAHDDAAGKCGATCMPGLIQCHDECGSEHPMADGECNVCVDLTSFVVTTDANGQPHRKYDNDSVERCVEQDKGNHSYRRDCSSTMLPPTLIGHLNRKEREKTRSQLKSTAESLHRQPLG